MSQRTAFWQAGVVCAAGLAAGPALAADAPLMDALLADHVVLQRDRPIPVWGVANAGEEVTVTASVTLEAGEVPAPARVRFCWGDSPLCNLYDTSGLPVGPFEIEIQ